MKLSGIPKIKSTIQFYQHEKCVYFANAGSALQVEDPTGFLAALCKAMDGSKNIEAIISELSLEFAAEIKYLSDALQTLDEAKLLENTEQKSPLGLDDYDLKRWSRNTEFFGSYSDYHTNKYDYQLRLKEVKVALLGLGGLGSHILYDLAALGVHHIKAVDFDCIELSNLNRQILYTEKDIGQLKTEAAKKRIKEFLPQGNFEFINRKLESQNDVEEMVKGSEIVICVADRPRKDMLSWLNESCIKHAIPYINGGLDVKRAIFFSVMPGQSACAECWKLNVREENSIANKLNQIEMQEGPQGVLAPAITSLVSTLTGLMLSEFLKIVMGISTPQSLNQLLMFDFDAMRISQAETWRKLNDCSVCGSRVV